MQRLLRYALLVHAYHMPKLAWSSFAEYIIHAVLRSSGSDLSSFVRPTRSFQLSGVQFFVSVAVKGHAYALYSRVGKTIADALCFAISFSFFSKYSCCFSDANSDILFAATITNVELQLIFSNRRRQISVEYGHRCHP